MTRTLESLVAVYIYTHTSKLLVNNKIGKYKRKDSDET